MELVTEPEIYSPNIDENGNYIDSILSFNCIKYGIRCQCGTRKDKIYQSSSTFSTHTKTKKHQLWLQQLNQNKANYYIENENLKEIIQTQKIIIAKYEKEIQNRNMTIEYLTQQLYRPEKSVNDLLIFD